MTISIPHPLLIPAAAVMAAVSILHLVACFADIHKLRIATKPMLMPAAIFLHCALCGLDKPLVILALAFGLIGDVMLMLINRGKVWFLIGMAAFLMGHIAYIAAAFAEGLPRLAYERHGALCIAGIALVYIAGLLLFYIFVGRKIYPRMRAACCIYAAVLAAMACVMLGSFVGCPGAWTLLMTLGGLLFVASDTILACKIFGIIKRRRLNFWVMITYIAAQTLLAVGFAMV